MANSRIPITFGEQIQSGDGMPGTRRVYQVSFNGNLLIQLVATSKEKLLDQLCSYYDTVKVNKIITIDSLGLV